MDIGYARASALRTPDSLAQADRLGRTHVRVSVDAVALDGHTLVVTESAPRFAAPAQS